MYKIAKRISFCYGHRLLNYDGKCARLHGHNAVAEIVLGAESLDTTGFVKDFALVKRRLKQFIDEQIDHRLLLRNVSTTLRHFGE